MGFLSVVHTRPFYTYIVSVILPFVLRVRLIYSVRVCLQPVHTSGVCQLDDDSLVNASFTSCQLKLLRLTNYLLNRA